MKRFHVNAEIQPGRPEIPDDPYHSLDDDTRETGGSSIKTDDGSRPGTNRVLFMPENDPPAMVAGNAETTDHFDESGGLSACVPGLPFDDYLESERLKGTVRDRASSLAGPLERNRNLSGVVRTIRDEGPSSIASDLQSEEEDNRDLDSAERTEKKISKEKEAESLTAEIDTGNAAQGRSVQGHSGWWRVAYGVPLIIMLILAIYQVVDGNHKYFSELQGRAAMIFSSLLELEGVSQIQEKHVSTSASHHEIEAQVREIREWQLRVTSRLDQLTAVIAEITAANNRQVEANENMRNEFREELRWKLESVSRDFAVFQGRLNEIQDTAESSETTAVDTESMPMLTSKIPPEEGIWVVNLASFPDEKQAGKLMVKLRKAGIPAVQQKANINGNALYRLRVTGFSTSDEAQQYASRLDRGLGLRGPWVSKR